MTDQSRRQSRRDFIKDGMRAVLLGGLVFSGLFIGWRGRRHSFYDSDGNCALELPCRDCSKIDRCQEPEASRERENKSQSRSFR